MLDAVSVVLAAGAVLVSKGEGLIVELGRGEEVLVIGGAPARHQELGSTKNQRNPV